MDPDATLDQIRAYIDEGTYSALDEAVTLFTALDAWLSSGGFLPRSWDLAIAKRPVEPSPTTHEVIWCERCANGEHNFNHPTKGPIDHCACCGKEKS